MVDKLQREDNFLHGLDEHQVQNMDPSYKLFLQHLRTDGDSYIFQMENGDNGAPALVRYEGGSIASRHINSETATFLSNSSPPRETVQHAPLPRGRPAKSCSLVDESYEVFLSLLKYKDGSMVVELEPGVTAIYEMEKGMHVASENIRNENVTDDLEMEETISENTQSQNVTSKDADGLAHANNVMYENQMDANVPVNLESQNVDDHRLVTYNNPSDLTECEDEHASMLSLGWPAPSSFEDKLMDVLSKPYDQNEYEELMSEVIDRKPVSRQRHLRSETKDYLTGAIGPSYLDHYPELAVQIETADCHEKLSLLRKFFFWLENLCHEGAYMPWIPKPIACEPIAADEYEPLLALEMGKADN